MPVTFLNRTKKKFKILSTVSVAQYDVHRFTDHHTGFNVVEDLVNSLRSAWINHPLPDGFSVILFTPDAEEFVVVPFRGFQFNYWSVPVSASLSGRELY